MNYSIDLQSPFGFSAYWYAVGLGLILLAAALRRLMDRPSGIRSPLRLDRLRRQSLSRIDEISRAFKSGELDTRGVHQRMSLEVRKFVQAVTGWRTETMVYDELAALARPEVADLIKTYSEPEFAFSTDADSQAAIDGGRQLVETMYGYALQQQKGAFSAMLRRGASRFLHFLLRLAPGGLKMKVFAHIQKRSLAVLDRIDLGIRLESLDPHTAHLRISREIQNFVLAAAGWRSTDPVYDNLRRMGRKQLSELARPYFEPESTCRTKEEAILSLNRSKELIQKWS